MISLNQQLKRIEIKDFEIQNQIAFNYFNDLPSSEREDKFFKALYIGVLALMEDRISSFLAKTTNELGTELESLKIIFDMKKELFYKSAVKGSLAEEEITDFLNNYFVEKKLRDKAILIRNLSGLLPKNKTGDIVCELDGKPDFLIAIECKFDKSVKVGDIESKDVFARNNDTAWSQLIEAQANRGARVSIIVFDISFVDISILKLCENVGYIPGIGMVAVVDSQKGDYNNLIIAYMLARDIALNAISIDLDKDILFMLVNRLIKGIGEILAIKTLVENNIENNKSILKQLEKSMLLMEFNQHYLKKFLNEGTLTKQDLLAYYNGDDIRDRYRIIEKEIIQQ